MPLSVAAGRVIIRRVLCKELRRVLPMPRSSQPVRLYLAAVSSSGGESPPSLLYRVFQAPTRLLAAEP